MQKTVSLRDMHSHFKAPLGFIDTNSSLKIKRQASPVYFSKLIPNEGYRLKRKLTSKIKDHQIQQDGSLKIASPHKENKLSFSGSAKPQLLFSLKNISKKGTFSNSREAKTLLFSAPIAKRHRQPRAMTIKSLQLQNNCESRIFFNPVNNCVSQTVDMKQSDFQKIRELGKGKFGTVWLVIHKQSNFVCAMKIIKKQIVRQQKIEHQVAKQIRIHNILRHVNIIAFYGYFCDQQNFFILTEFATGEQIYSLIKKHSRISQSAASRIVGETIKGLEVIHNLGFIHRDIKPENLVLQFNTIKICDFGWAAECSSNEMRRSICGTPLYYSPEMVTHSLHNSLIDVWTVGILAYELVVGRIPFRIWSEFDLPIILEQQITFPEYIDLDDTTKHFILSCLTKSVYFRPTISMVKDHQFICKRNKFLSNKLENEVVQTISKLF